MNSKGRPSGQVGCPASISVAGTEVSIESHPPVATYRSGVRQPDQQIWMRYHQLENDPSHPTTSV